MNNQLIVSQINFRQNFLSSEFLIKTLSYENENTIQENWITFLKSRGIPQLPFSLINKIS